ncbi:MAG: response regulator transcription factor [Alistipes sp.]|nr:response regulator transcription factor [Candidatus Alistipes equi]
MTSEDFEIILVDDHTLFRSGLKGLLLSSGFKSVREFGSGEDFLREINSISDDAIVFMDYAMTGDNGAQTTLKALGMVPTMRIICLSMYGERHYYEKMIEAGAKGFLRKDSDISEVRMAIEVVASGEEYFSRDILREIEKNDPLTYDTLSEREIEVLVHICQGLSTSEIAERLFLSKRTVDAHRANILEKCKCKNTASLVVYALKNKIIDI